MLDKTPQFYFITRKNIETKKQPVLRRWQPSTFMPGRLRLACLWWLNIDFGQPFPEERYMMKCLLNNTINMQEIIFWIGEKMMISGVHMHWAVVIVRLSHLQATVAAFTCLLWRKKGLALLYHSIEEMEMQTKKTLYFFVCFPQNYTCHSLQFKYYLASNGG